MSSYAEIMSKLQKLFTPYCCCFANQSIIKETFFSFFQLITMQGEKLKELEEQMEQTSFITNIQGEESTLSSGVDVNLMASDYQEFKTEMAKRFEDIPTNKDIQKLIKQILKKINTNDLNDLLSSRKFKDDIIDVSSKKFK